ncbi:MAG TPA: DNA repair protein RadA [Armatimonadota bacterium]|jgi:DNA repair protein RadA/Sms
MAKTQTKYVCTQCGHEELRWRGQCPECDGWGTLQEEVGLKPSPAAVARSRSPLGAEAPRRIAEIGLEDFGRWSTGIGELDRVLGNTALDGKLQVGVVPGSVVLLGGDPGIGKSTLLTQVGHIVSRTVGPVLYASGEESVQQIKMRSRRLGPSGADLYLVSETDIDSIERAVAQVNPCCVVVDSIQTMRHPEVDSSPGTVSQVRTCTEALMRLAKGRNTAVFLVGHVTKEGAIAGPRVLEHMVDTVLYFEGERTQTYRILRAVKNRFGSTNEIGVFEMGGEGLCEVENPSEMLLSERDANGPGSVVTAAMEGTRPLLLEVQALAAPSHLAQPRRSATGMDFNRTQMVLAVLEKRVGLRLGNLDVFTNVAGGVKLMEPAADLAVALAVASSLSDIPIDAETLAIGEIGLAGEVRAVQNVEKRLQEAARLGFRRAIVPARSARRLGAGIGLELVPVQTVRGAVEVAFSG